ncbi:hypothetical protein NDU88_006609 [Pleurodeles waltl]|uniref:Uncharacterized protein n=1 Tax=Pleurodeles waltl TaxID=8319 RepID=A0AAV7RQP5_PLEWA|nr:hypothetical protein NDU88_006609 [Pleurodeles waltl]
MYIIRTLEEAEALPDMDLEQSKPLPGSSEETSRVTPGNRGCVAQQLKKKLPKPSEKGTGGKERTCSAVCGTVRAYLRQDQNPKTRSVPVDEEVLTMKHMAFPPYS